MLPYSGNYFRSSSDESQGARREPGGHHSCCSVPCEVRRVRPTHQRLSIHDYLPQTFHDGAAEASKCEWSSHIAASLTPEEAGALAWVLIDTMMQVRFGPATSLYDTWREHTLAGTKIPSPDKETIASFIEPVFGLPDAAEERGPPARPRRRVALAPAHQGQRSRPRPTRPEGRRHRRRRRRVLHLREPRGRAAVPALGEQEEHRLRVAVDQPQQGVHSKSRPPASVTSPRSSAPSRRAPTTPRRSPSWPRCPPRGPKATSRSAPV